VKSALDAAVKAIGSDQLALAHFYGSSVRLVFHDAIDLDLTQTDLMGADGCLGDALGSKGLYEASSPVMTTLEPIYQQFCDSISRADFWVLFGKLVVEKADPTKTISLPFQYGRRAAASCSEGIGRDPDAQDGVDAITQAFVVQLGLSYTDAVTLSGAHTLGHVHPSISGYGGHPGIETSGVTVNAFDSTPTQFDNDYFVKLRNVPWASIFTQDLKLSDKNIWIDMNCGANNQLPPGPTPDEVNNCEDKLIDLNTDMALFFPLNTTSFYNPLGARTGLAMNIQHCVNGEFGSTGDANDDINCYAPIGNHPFQGDVIVYFTYDDPTGNIRITKDFMVPVVRLYTDGPQANAQFLKGFAKSWVKMVSAGYGVADDGVGGKLGRLTSFDPATC